MHFILGTLSGLIIGGVAGLMSTPQTGKENRQTVKSYANDVSSQAKTVTDQANDLKSSVDNLKFEIDKIKGPVMTEFNTIKSEYELELNPRLRRIQEQQEKLNKDINEMSESI